LPFAPQARRPDDAWISEAGARGAPTSPARAGQDEAAERALDDDDGGEEGEMASAGGSPAADDDDGNAADDDDDDDDDDDSETAPGRREADVEERSSAAGNGASATRLDTPASEPNSEAEAPLAKKPRGGAARR
jgi:hypothetical protein